MSFRNLDFLEGQTFTKVERIDDEIHFHNENGYWRFYHAQDCCETVYIESVAGDLSDLENTPILLAEERWESGEEDRFEHYTYTFYTLGTKNGYVDIRWNGYSNGYYSESVDHEFVKNADEN